MKVSKANLLPTWFKRGDVDAFYSEDDTNLNHPLDMINY